MGGQDGAGIGMKNAQGYNGLHNGLGRPNPDDEDEQGWRVTYMDTITLLLAFFIILSSLIDSRFINIDWEEEQQTAPETEQVAIRNSVLLLYNDLNTMLGPYIRAGLLEMEHNFIEINIRYAGSSFFHTASADLLPSGRMLIDLTMEAFERAGAERFNIDVQGHTDSRPMNPGTAFETNWELSAVRAARIARYMIVNGFDSARLTASGFAASRLLMPEFTIDGQPIPEHMAMNRRIEFRLYIPGITDARLDPPKD